MGTLPLIGQIFHVVHMVVDRMLLKPYRKYPSYSSMIMKMWLMVAVVLTVAFVLIKASSRGRQVSAILLTSFCRMVTLLPNYTQLLMATLMTRVLTATTTPKSS
jgi:hypothetical protein